MPIPSQIRRQFYSRASGWPEKRAEILKRAGGRFAAQGRYLGGAKCEQCGKPDRKRVWVYRMFSGQVWAAKRFSHAWRYCWLGGAQLELSVRWTGRSRPRRVLVILTVAHLNHTPGDDRLENLKALCQWCHNAHDAGMRSKHASVTRRVRKDRARPLFGHTGARST